MNFLKKLFNSPKHKKLAHSVESADQFVNSLESLGYYKYAKPDDVSDLKKNLSESISEHGVLSTLHDDDTYLTKDLRYHYCDGETLYEQGGFLEQIKEMQPAFDKIGLKLDISDYYEEWDQENRWLDHWVTINGKAYIIFEHFKETGWGEAAAKFAEIINDQLELQGKDERLYLINGGNDGHVIFLTDKQFALIDSFLSDEEWKPLKVNDWCRVMKVQMP